MLCYLCKCVLTNSEKQKRLITKKGIVPSNNINTLFDIIEVSSIAICTGCKEKYNIWKDI